MINLHTRCTPNIHEENCSQKYYYDELQNSSFDIRINIQTTQIHPNILVISHCVVMNLLASCIY